MFEHYTENARQVVACAREEASGVGSLSIEAEHLLLGIIRSGEVQLNELLKLNDLERALRMDITATAQPDIGAKHDITLSNQSKRILAYAAEEAMRIDSPVIGSGHLLLGILREPESMASRFLSVHDIDLPHVRQIVAILSGSHSGNSGRFRRSPIGWTTTVGRRYWIGGAAQLATFILLGVGVANSTARGRDLLLTGAVWLVAALAWNILGPSSFFWNFGKRNRAVAMAASYTVFYLLQVLMLGWLIPLGVGVYRVIWR